MNALRGLIMGGAAMFALSLTTLAPAEAGCLGLFGKGCCDSAPACCEAEPVCCEPEPVCCEPEPVCCEPAPVCCAPPPPVSVTWCVKDPCGCETYEVTACVPACCAAEVPCLAGWRKGLFGRKVLTYEFPGCGHSVEVVITCFGKTIVR